MKFFIMKFLFFSILLVLPLILASNAYAYTITDDATGGDCSAIGTWDSGSKTCTLSGDLTEGIVIGSNNITLDGNDNILFGPGGSFENYGILVEVRTNIFLKNLIVDNFYVGIQLNDSFDNTISDNIIQNIEHEGIVLSSFSENNLVSDNTVTGNGGHGIVSNSDDNEIRNNVSTHNEVGISVFASSGSKVIENVVKSNQQGMEISSNNILIEGNAIEDNTSRGILISGNSNTVQENNISNNVRGLHVGGDSNTKIIRNDIIGNSESGLTEGGSTEIYQNNFVSNGVSVKSGSSSAVYSPSSITGGNYWSDYSPTCSNTNNDNFCDEPYPFSGGTVNVHDDYVWTIQDGWLTSINTPNDVTLDAIDSSGASYDYSAAATHDGASISVTCDPVSGSIFPIGTSEVVCIVSNGIKSTFSVTVNPLSSIISVNSPPTESNTTVEGNNPDLKIFASGYIENPIGGITTISSVWKDPAGVIVYDEILQVDSQGQFNNEFDNPMFVGEMRDSGLYTTTYTYDDVVLEYSWNYLSSVYEPEPEPEPENEVIIVPANGSGAPGCEETSQGCYLPSTAYVTIGGTIIFSNTDTAAHTFTAGSGSGNTGEFDSGLVMSGSSYEYSPDHEGDIPYWCMVHPWMQGLIIVGGGTAPPPTPDPEPESISVSINRTYFESGDTVIFSGTITNYDSSSGKGLTYLIKSPDNNIVAIGQLAPSSNGSFSKSFDVGGSLYKVDGDYLIEVRYGSLIADVEFEFETDDYISPTPQPEPYPEQDELEILSLSTKKSQYRTGDTIVITGKVSTNDFNKSVTLQIFKGGNMVDISQVSVSLSETFSHTVIAEGPLWKENGRFTVKASYGHDTEDTSFVYRYDDSTTDQKCGPGTVFDPETNSCILDSIPTPKPTADYDGIVNIQEGSAAPGCEETNSCYLPYEVHVKRYGEVTWYNYDSAAHTVTGGTPSEGPSGEFDSGLLMAGGSYSATFDETGVYPYFDMVHPWAIGFVIVGDGTAPPPKPPPKPETDMDLEISVNERVYDLGELVGIEVKVEHISGSQKVAIDVKDPRGNSVVSRSLTFTSDDQVGEIEFRISEEYRTGTYKVTATTSDNGKTIKDSTHFKVKSQYNSFKITNVDVTDQQGNPSDLEVGEIGFIKVELESNKSIVTLVTVNLFDSELTSIGIGSVKTTLSSGNSEIILSFMIPEDAAIGPADIYVNAFSDWPSNGGIPLTGEVSTMEDIQ